MASTTAAGCCRCAACAAPGITSNVPTSTAAAIYHVPLPEVTPAQRRVAKMTNFAISYGVTGYGLSERTGLPQDEALRHPHDRQPKPHGAGPKVGHNRHRQRHHQPL